MVNFNRSEHSKRDNDMVTINHSGLMCLCHKTLCYLTRTITVPLSQAQSNTSPPTFTFQQQNTQKYSWRFHPFSWHGINKVSVIPSATSPPAVKTRSAQHIKIRTEHCSNQTVRMMCVKAVYCIYRPNRPTFSLLCPYLQYQMLIVEIKIQ